MITIVIVIVSLLMIICAAEMVNSLEQAFYDNEDQRLIEETMDLLTRTHVGAFDQPSHEVPEWVRTVDHLKKRSDFNG